MLRRGCGRMRNRLPGRWRAGVAPLRQDGRGGATGPCAEARDVVAPTTRRGSRRSTAMLCVVDRGARTPRPRRRAHGAAAGAAARPQRARCVEAKIRRASQHQRRLGARAMRRTGYIRRSRCALLGETLRRGARACSRRRASLVPARSIRGACAAARSSNGTTATSASGTRSARPETGAGRQCSDSSRWTSAGAEPVAAGAWGMTASARRCAARCARTAAGARSVAISTTTRSAEVDLGRRRRSMQCATTSGLRGRRRDVRARRRRGELRLGLVSDARSTPAARATSRSAIFRPASARMGRGRTPVARCAPTSSPSRSASAATAS